MRFFCQRRRFSTWQPIDEASSTTPIKSLIKFGNDAANLSLVGEEVQKA